MSMKGKNYKRSLFEKETKNDIFLMQHFSGKDKLILRGNLEASPFIIINQWKWSKAQLSDFHASIVLMVEVIEFENSPQLLSAISIELLVSISKN